MYLSLLELDAGNLSAAEREGRLAVDLLSGSPDIQAAAQARLARVLLAAGRADEALACAARAEQALERCDPEAEATVRLSSAEALAASGRTDEARSAIAVARERLLTRASKLRLVAHREAFVSRVADHARTLALAAVWVDGAVAGEGAPVRLSA
jgi:predicted negative regulator of RcsB-dependent stress response